MFPRVEEAKHTGSHLPDELPNTDEGGPPIDARQDGDRRGVGNEDGPHKVVADMFQALNDIGYSIPAQGSTYRNGEAMQTKDYNDLAEVPEAVASATAAAARNAAHLANVFTTGNTRLQ